MCCNSRAAPGPGRSNCARGSRSFDFVIPGREANPESRDSGSGPSDHPGMTGEIISGNSNMKSSNAFDTVVYVATGLTGQLVAEYLASHYRDDAQLKWAMAGRNLDKL